MLRGRNTSLKRGLLLVVLLALLPITVFGVFQSIANWNGVQRTAMEAVRANAKAIAERERDAFLVANRLLMVAAANPDIRDMTPKCSEVLKAGFEGYKPIINFLRTDPSGRARCSILPFRPELEVAGEDWWQATKMASGITVSQPILGPVAGVPIIVIALPIRDERGRFAGTLSAGLDISMLAKSVAASPEAATGAIAIVSKSGQLVASDTPTLPFNIPANLGNGVAGMLTSRDESEWVYATSALSGDGLFAVYAEPRSKILSSALAQFRAGIILPLLAITLTLLAIWFGTNRLVIRWLNSLRQVSDAFAHGNFTDNRHKFANAPIELRELSDDLHDMANLIENRTTALTDALNAKTELTREIHHRVKNNLQIVTSLLTMQASRIKGDDAQTALKQARARVVALALIHRLTYEQDNDTTQPTVAVENLLQELCKQLRYAHRERRGVDLNSRTEDFAISTDLAVPLALFIVEAVTNSYRHGFGDGETGKIELALELKDTEALLTVNDNGRGYDVSAQEQNDMGTELMHGFAAQLNGAATLSSKLGSGSQTTLRFPV